MSDVRGYKLKFECEDDGVRRYESSYSSSDQERLAKALSDDIARMIEATMTFPPSSMDVARAIEGDTFGFVKGIAYALSVGWTGEFGEDECVDVIVDVEKLAQGRSDLERATVRWVLRKCGIKMKDEPQ